MDKAPASRGKLIGYLMLVISGALYGAGFAFAKWALQELSVGEMILLRFAFASMVLAAVFWSEARCREKPFLRADYKLFVIAAFIGIPVEFLVQFSGVARTTVSHASLMVGVMPVLLAAGAALFAHEHLNKTGWIALVTSVIGAALVAFGTGKTATNGPTVTGDLLVVASLFAGVAWMLMSQRLMAKGYSTTLTTTLITLVGTIMLAFWVLPREGLPPLEKLSTRGWLSVISMGVLSTALSSLL